MKVAVMTDTNSGISVREGERLGAFVLPMPVLVEDRTYYEGIDITQEEFYRLLLEGRTITTSQPSPGDVLAMWERILREYDALVYIPMSSGLSASYRTASALALEFGGRVQVVDHRSVSVAQRCGVEDALRLAAAGRTAEEIRHALEAVAADTVIYIGVETLEYLRRGGRITPAAAKMGAALHIKPLLQIRGELLEACAKARGTRACREQLIERMREWVEAYSAGGAPYTLAAAGSFLDASEEHAWLEQVRAAFPTQEVRYDPLALSVGTHVGPDAFGLAITKRAG